MNKAVNQLLTVTLLCAWAAFSALAVQAAESPAEAAKPEAASAASSGESAPASESGSEPEEQQFEPFDSLPYKVGVTTRSAAMGKGARATDKSGDLGDALEWNDVPWRLTLRFSGEGASALLKCLILRTVSVEPELEIRIDKSLAESGYNRFRTVHRDGVANSVYGSERFTNLRETAAENHRKGHPASKTVAKEMAEETLIISVPGKSGWKLIMIRAGEFGVGGSAHKHNPDR